VGTPRPQASEDDVKRALEALSTIDEVDVHRENELNGHEWRITYKSNLGNLKLIGSHPQRHEMQIVRTLGGFPTPLGGSFALQFGGETTTLLPFNCEEEEMVAALQALNTVGTVVVNREGPIGQGQYIWEVTFRDNLGDLPLLTFVNQLTGTDPVITVTSQQEGVAYSLFGADPKIVSEDLIAGRPSYVATYRPAAVGSYALVVRQLLAGGLKAQYFDNQWLQGDPVVVRVDPELNFDWGTGLITPYGRDYVSGRWNGKILPPVTETFTFFLYADNAVRMWLDHTLVIDTWDSPLCCNETLAFKRLTEGVFVDVRIEWREITGAAGISLKWASLSTFKQVIPKTHLFNAEHIQGSPFDIDVLPGGTDFPFTEAFGPGLVANTVGTPTFFYVQARDADGNNKTEPGDDFTVTIDGPPGVDIAATPEYVGGGLYRVDYTLTVQGDYTIGVTMGGHHIQCGRASASPCSPWTIHAKAAHLSFETTDTYGPGLHDCVVGDVHEFTIFAYDTYKNKILHGGYTFDATVVHTDASLELVYNANVFDLGDGDYRVTYTTEVAGTYTVNIFFEGQRILTDGTRPASTPLCVHTALYGPTSVTTGVGLTSTTANEFAFFDVFGRDKFHNPRTGDGPDGDGTTDVFQAVLTGPLGEQYRTTSATVTVTVTATGGTFTMAVNGQGTPALPYDIPPYALEVELARVLEDPFAVAELRTSSPAVPASPSHWSQVNKTVEVFLESSAPGVRVYRVTLLSIPHLIGDVPRGLPAWSPSIITAAGVGLTGTGPAVSVVPLAALGQYPMRYNIHAAGDWRLDITTPGAAGAHISGSPFTVHVAVAVTHPQSSHAQGVGLVGGVVGEVLQYTVQANDRRVYEVQTVSTRATVTATVAEVQTLTCGSATTTFTLSFRGATTGTITGTDLVASLATALNGLASIGAGGVTVASSLPAQTTICGAAVNGAALTITFNSGAAATVGDVPMLTVASSAGTAPVVGELVTGKVASRREVQGLTCSLAAGASFTLSFAGASVSVTGATLVSTLGATLSTAFGTTITASSTQAAVCATSSAATVSLTFVSYIGDAPSVTSDSGSVVVTELISGVAPVWGVFRLSFKGQTTEPISATADDAAMATALAALTTIGAVTVTSASVGLDAFGRPGLTRTWMITFDQSYSYPSNMGDLPLLVASWSYDSLTEPLGFARGVQPPVVDVSEVVRGEWGNHRDVPSDLGITTLFMEHRALDNKYLDMHETQTITCTATSGTFRVSLSTGSDTRYATLDATDTFVGAATKLNAAFNGARPPLWLAPCVRRGSEGVALALARVCLSDLCGFSCLCSLLVRFARRPSALHHRHRWCGEPHRRQR
jgi:hypothetical protein